MTNKNINLKNKPFLLQPVGKDYLWGGERLNQDFAKGIRLEPLAETWECSTHPDGVSTVKSGKYAGCLLTDVLREHPEYLGTHPRKTNGGLPILIKFIDAKEKLSVQVHPSDEYALQYENGQLGKTEMWYVLDAEDGAELVYGFQHSVDKDTLRKSITQGNIEKYLQKVPIKKDDVFYIEAGMVHAIGAGALIVEIQENSNLTYRIYDYNRRDKDGKLRELHIDKALDVINCTQSKRPTQPMRVLRYRRGCASEFLCRCKYFEVERWLLNTECYRELVDVEAGMNSFQVLLCISGCGVVLEEDKNGIEFFKGDCIFVPANSVPLKLHGKAQLLKVCC